MLWVGGWVGGWGFYLVPRPSSSMMRREWEVAVWVGG